MNRLLEAIQAEPSHLERKLVKTDEMLSEIHQLLASIEQEPMDYEGKLAVRLMWDATEKLLAARSKLEMVRDLLLMAREPLVAATQPLGTAGVSTKTGKVPLGAAINKPQKEIDHLLPMKGPFVLAVFQYRIAQTNLQAARKLLKRRQTEVK